MFGNSINRNINLQLGVLSVEMMDCKTEWSVFIQCKLNINITVCICDSVSFGLRIDDHNRIIGLARDGQIALGRHIIWSIARYRHGRIRIEYHR